MLSKLYLLFSHYVLLGCRNTIDFSYFELVLSHELVIIPVYFLFFGRVYIRLYVHLFSSVQSLSRVRLCDPMDCSMPDFPVHHQLPKFTQTHVHQVDDAIQPSSVVPFSSCLQSFPASGSFPVSQFFASGGQSIGISASTSVLPMNIQD